MVFLFNKKMMLDDEPGAGSEGEIYEKTSLESGMLEQVSVASYENGLTLNVLNLLDDGGATLSPRSCLLRVSNKESKIYGPDRIGVNRYYPGAYVSRSQSIAGTDTDPAPVPDNPPASNPDAPSQ